MKRKQHYRMAAQAVQNGTADAGLRSPGKCAVILGLSALALMLATGTLQAQPALNDCARITDNAARLACYDRAMNGSASQPDSGAAAGRAIGNSSNLPVVRLPRSESAGPAPGAENSASPSPQSQAPAQSRGQSAEPSREEQVTETRAQPSGDDFGLPPRLTEAQEADSSREYTVADAQHTDLTGWRLEFTNGEVWKQIGTHDYDIEVGAEYTISRNGFKSYFLSNADNRRRMRVERIE